MQSYGLIRTEPCTSATAALALNSDVGLAVARPRRRRTRTSRRSTRGQRRLRRHLTFSVDALAAARAACVRRTPSEHGHVDRRQRIDLRRRRRARRSDSRRSRRTPASRSATHKITVTQASSAAQKDSDTALGGSTVIDGTNDTLTSKVNGADDTLSIAHGTYTATQLAQAVQTRPTAQARRSAATSLGSGEAATRDDTRRKHGQHPGHGRRRLERAEPVDRRRRDHRHRRQAARSTAVRRRRSPRSIPAKQSR